MCQTPVFLEFRCSPRRAPLHLPQSEGIGLVGFEPTACRRGDRSTVTCRARLYRVQFCNIARVALLRIGWQSFRYGSKPTAFHVSWPSTGRCCGGEYGLPNSRKNRRSVVRFSRCVTRNNKTPLIKIGLVGFEPTASWSRTRRDTKLRYSPFYRICPANAVLYFAYFASDSKAVPWRQVRFGRVTRNYFVFFRTKSVDNEPLHLESQHSFLPCSHRNLFHPPSQAAWRLSFNSRPRRSAPFVPCAI